MLESIRSWLFPPACAACDAPGPALCASCAPSLHEAQAFAVDGIPAFALGPYEGALRQAIVAMKRGERDPLDALAELLAARAPIEGALVPVATTRFRASQRGFDQSVELVRRIAQQRGVPSAEVLRKRGGAQDGRSRHARLAAAGRFRLAEIAQMPVEVTLLDDVCTTGATLRDAAASLARAGIAVRRIIVAARTAPGRSRSTEPNAARAGR